MLRSPFCCAYVFMRLLRHKTLSLQPSSITPTSTPALASTPSPSQDATEATDTRREAADKRRKDASMMPVTDISGSWRMDRDLHPSLRDRLLHTHSRYDGREDCVEP